MASPRIQQKPGPRLVPKPELASTQRGTRDSVLRLLFAERSEEIAPILLEEIVNGGFPKAAVLEVDFERGEIKSTASLNCNRAWLRKFCIPLWVGENLIVRVLQKLEPATLSIGPKGESFFAYPMIYRSRTRCWEAERERRRTCLAVQNSYLSGKLTFDEQVCAACGMRGYAKVILAQLPRQVQNVEIRTLCSLIERANAQLARLFKVEHYYTRMRDTQVDVGRMRTVMQSMPDPVILTDPQHRVIVQNKAAERFFRVPEGVSEGGRRAVELNNLLFSAALSSLMVSPNETSRDLTLVDVMEGEEVLFEAVCAPTYSNDSVRSGMVTVMRDVTDLRKADQEVRANLEKLRAAEEIVRQDRDRLNLVIENVGDPIVVADNSAKLVLLDPLAKLLFGATDDDKAPEIVNNQAKLDAYLTAFTFSFADKESKSLTLYNPAAGLEVEYASRSGKIYDARGQVAYTVTVLRDFSAWKKLEQMQLERRMLEIEKFAATGRLAGTIAHEINNPLESIKNAIHLMAGKLDPESQPFYDVLKSETERVTRIVRQMLGLYRHASQIATFDLNLVVEDTIALFARTLTKAGIELEKRLEEIAPIKGSADQFRQLLSNLVVNARDSMPDGGKLVIHTKQFFGRNQNHGWVSITIADTGVGVAPEMRQAIFEPFVSTKGERGTGLGLWIVKGIVENHNGRIKLHSTLGKGTVMRITFPTPR